MNRLALPLLLLVPLFVSAPAALADGQDESEGAHQKTRQAAYPALPTAAVLDAVARRESMTFVVDARVPEQLVTGQLATRDITWSTLLSLLRHNGLAAYRGENVVNIVPGATIRQHPLPIANADDPSLADDEWVTRVVFLDNAKAGRLIPILRPLLPQQGHLAAHEESNGILIVARYANLRRITGLIQQLDAAAGQASR